MNNEIITTETNNIVVLTDVESIVSRYIGFYNKTIEGVLGMSKAVFDASRLNADQREEFCQKTNLDEKSATFKKYVKIGKKYEVFFKYQDKLPPNWTSLYTISSLKDEVVNILLENDEITPNMTGLELKNLMSRYTDTVLTSMTKNKYEKEKTDLVFDLRLTGESKSKILPLLKLLKELRSDDSIKIDGNEIFKTSLTLA
jgi:hypothetical protein